MSAFASIATEHADEAGFLWYLHTLNRTSPIHSLTSLAQHEERLLAHLDGLLCAGADAVAAALEAADSSGQPMAAVPLCWLVAAAPGRHRELEEALILLLDERPALESALADLLALLPDDQRQTAIQLLWPLGAPARRAAIAGASLARQMPPDLLGAALSDGDAATRALALRSIGACGLIDQLDRCRHALTGPTPERTAAAWSLGLLAGESLDILQTIGADDIAARMALLRRLPAERAAPWCAAMLEGRAEVEASVDRADASMIPWLLDRLRDPLLGRLAAHAMTVLGGIDPAGHNLIGQPPAAPATASGDGESEEESDVGLDPDRNLPWFDDQRARTWWASAAEHLPQGRILAGRPVDRSSLDEILANGSQPIRLAAAYELAALTGKGLFPTDAPARVQRRLLAAGWGR